MARLWLSGARVAVDHLQPHLAQQRQFGSARSPRLEVESVSNCRRPLAKHLTPVRMVRERSRLHGRVIRSTVVR